MIADINITEKSFGPKTLMKSIKFSIDDGEKVGVVGRNGVGKTTLFGILAGTDTDYTGEVIYRRGAVVAKTSQEHHAAAGQELIEYILGGLPEYAKLSRIIETYPDTMGDDLRKITEYTEALQRFDDLGYYQISEKVERELANFQLGGRAHDQFSQLSGGQKRLAEIVKIMHSNAHLALIDEPTNHMDYVAKQQFIDWMTEAREAVLVITHDRDVLRNVDRIVEMREGGAVSYPGNYDAYLKQNSVKTGTAMNDFEMVERRIANLKTKVIDYQRLKEKSRNPSTIQKFKRLENVSREELAKLQQIEKPQFWIDKDSVENLNYKSTAQYAKFKAKNIHMSGINTDESRSSRILVDAKNLSLGYDSPLFSDVNFQLRENESVEFRGRNGVGKTTLIKAILDQFAGRPIETSKNGELFVDSHATIGVYEQEISQTYFELPLGQAIERLYLDRNLSISQTKIMQLMSDYLFDPIGDAMIPLSQLSGGQKARFQMISMLANEPQLLILDEPTNHLDLPSIEELETALGKYSGAVIYVSHDGYFRENLGGGVVQIGSR